MQQISRNLRAYCHMLNLTQLQSRKLHTGATHKGANEGTATSGDVNKGPTNLLYHITHYQKGYKNVL